MAQFDCSAQAITTSWFSADTARQAAFSQSTAKVTVLPSAESRISVTAIFDKPNSVVKIESVSGLLFFTILGAYF